MRIGLADWRPDMADLGTELVADLFGVLPGPNCYYPWPALTELTEALPADCLGAIAVQASDGTQGVFAGTATALYKLDASDFSWEDVTRAAGGDYSASDTTPWTFTLFEYGANAAVIACNINDAPQTFLLGSSTDFADLGGSPPQAALCGVWGNQLVLGRLTGDEHAVQGSDIDDPTVWTPSSSNSAFYQAFGEGGAVTGFNNSDHPVIIQERAIRRAAIVGLPDKIIFDQIANDRGAPSQRSVAASDEWVFFIDHDGFYAVTAESGIRPVGHGRVNRWFLENAEATWLDRVHGVVDHARSRVYWAFSTGGAGLDKIITYDWRLDRWSQADVAVQVLFNMQNPAMSLELIGTLFGSLDDLGEESLDSRQFAAGAPTIGAVSIDRKAGIFGGAPLAARLVTAEFGEPQRRMRLHKAYSQIDTNDATIRVQRRNRRGEAFSTIIAPIPVNNSGWHPLRHSSRFFRLQVDIPVDTDWSKAEAVHVEGVREGVR